MLPSVRQPASTPAWWVSVCGFTGITISASVISVCPPWSEKFFPQTEQSQYSVFPAAVQAASCLSWWVSVCGFTEITISASAISVWPALSENFFPHMEQSQYSTTPVCVQSAAFPSWWVSVWSAIGISVSVISVRPSSSENFFPQTEQSQYSLTPVCIQSAAFPSWWVRAAPLLWRQGRIFTVFETVPFSSWV